MSTPSTSTPSELTFATLTKAVKTAAAFRCRRRLQPAGGEGDKVFPPTFAGAVYAIEKRRVPGREGSVHCVLLDSVQSQANRMEEALQDALDANRFKMPYVVVDFSEQPRISRPERIPPSGRRSSGLRSWSLRHSFAPEKPVPESSLGTSFQSTIGQYGRRTQASQSRNRPLHFNLRLKSRVSAMSARLRVPG
jgi:hypothetical protein